MLYCIILHITVCLLQFCILWKLYVADALCLVFQTEPTASSPDPYFEPVVKLEAQTLNSLEEDEDVLIKLYELAI